ncbi:MAG TPA: hypothetical protein VJA40_05385 [archaeon]|nr:hypothetical protein [archaeon]
MTLSTLSLLIAFLAGAPVFSQEFDGTTCFNDSHCARNQFGDKQCVMVNPPDFIGPPAYAPDSTCKCDGSTGKCYDSVKFDGTRCLNDSHCARSFLGEKECLVKLPPDFIGPPAYVDDSTCSCNQGTGLCGESVTEIIEFDEETGEPVTAYPGLVFDLELSEGVAVKGVPRIALNWDYSQVGVGRGVDCTSMFCDTVQIVQTVLKYSEKITQPSKGVSVEVYSLEDTFSQNTLKAMQEYGKTGVLLNDYSILPVEWTGKISTGLEVKTPGIAGFACGKKSLEIKKDDGGKVKAELEHLEDEEANELCSKNVLLHLPLDAPLIQKKSANKNTFPTPDVGFASKKKGLESFAVFVTPGESILNFGDYQANSLSATVKVADAVESDSSLGVFVAEVKDLDGKTSGKLYFPKNEPQLLTLDKTNHVASRKNQFLGLPQGIDKLYSNDPAELEMASSQATLDSTLAVHEYANYRIETLPTDAQNTRTGDDCVFLKTTLPNTPQNQYLKLGYFGKECSERALKPLRLGYGAGSVVSDFYQLLRECGTDKSATCKAVEKQAPQIDLVWQDSELHLSYNLAALYYEAYGPPIIVEAGAVPDYVSNNNGSLSIVAVVARATPSTSLKVDLSVLGGGEVRMEKTEVDEETGFTVYEASAAITKSIPASAYTVLVSIDDASRTQASYRITNYLEVQFVVYDKEEWESLEARPATPEEIIEAEKVASNDPTARIATTTSLNPPLNQTHPFLYYGGKIEDLGKIFEGPENNKNSFFGLGIGGIKDKVIDKFVGSPDFAIEGQAWDEEHFFLVVDESKQTKPECKGMQSQLAVDERVEIPNIPAVKGCLNHIYYNIDNVEPVSQGVFFGYKSNVKFEKAYGVYNTDTLKPAAIVYLVIPAKHLDKVPSAVPRDKVLTSESKGSEWRNDLRDVVRYLFSQTHTVQENGTAKEVLYFEEVERNEYVVNDTTLTTVGAKVREESEKKGLAKKLLLAENVPDGIPEELRPFERFFVKPRGPYSDFQDYLLGEQLGMSAEVKQARIPGKVAREVKTAFERHYSKDLELFGVFSGEYDAGTGEFTAKRVLIVPEEFSSTYTIDVEGALKSGKFNLNELIPSNEVIGGVVHSHPQLSFRDVGPSDVDVYKNFMVFPDAESRGSKWNVFVSNKGSLARNGSGPSILVDSTRLTQNFSLDSVLDDDLIVLNTDYRKAGFAVPEGSGKSVRVKREVLERAIRHDAELVPERIKAELKEFMKRHVGEPYLEVGPVDYYQPVALQTVKDTLETEIPYLVKKRIIEKPAIIQGGTAGILRKSGIKKSDLTFNNFNPFPKPGVLKKVKNVVIQPEAVEELAAKATRPIEFFGFGVGELNKKTGTLVVRKVVFVPDQFATSSVVDIGDAARTGTLFNEFLKAGLKEGDVVGAVTFHYHPEDVAGSVKLKYQAVWPSSPHVRELSGGEKQLSHADLLVSRSKATIMVQGRNFYAYTPDPEVFKGKPPSIEALIEKNTELVLKNAELHEKGVLEALPTRSGWNVTDVVKEEKLARKASNEAVRLNLEGGVPLPEAITDDLTTLKASIALKERKISELRAAGNPLDVEIMRKQAEITELNQQFKAVNKSLEEVQRLRSTKALSDYFLPPETVNALATGKKLTPNESVLERIREERSPEARKQAKTTMRETPVETSVETEPAVKKFVEKEKAAGNVSKNPSKVWKFAKGAGELGAGTVLSYALYWGIDTGVEKTVLLFNPSVTQEDIKRLKENKLYSTTLELTSATIGFTASSQAVWHAAKRGWVDAGKTASTKTKFLKAGKNAVKVGKVTAGKVFIITGILLTTFDVLEWGNDSYKQRHTDPDIVDRYLASGNWFKKGAGGFLWVGRGTVGAGQGFMDVAEVVTIHNITHPDRCYGDPYCGRY